jgi:hypothetical protein
MSEKIYRSTELTQYAFKDGNDKVTLVSYFHPSSVPSFYDTYTKDGIKNTVHYGKIFILRNEDKP